MAHKVGDCSIVAIIQSLYNQQVQQYNLQSDYTKTVESYTSDLRAALSILYNANDFSSFVESMQSAIEQNLTNAWISGAASCGISESDISDAEVSELFGLILRDFSFIAGLGADVISRRAQGALIESFYPRLNIWSNRWEETRSIAQSMSCGDQKLMWQFDSAKDNCVDCTQLNGKVKRASDWAASGIHPQMPTLACKGFNCGCEFVATDAPLSAGQIAPSLSPTRGGLLGGAIAGSALVAASIARQQAINLASGTNVGDEFLNLETGHNLTLGNSITITENGNSYTGIVFATSPSIVEISPPLDFSFSINATIRRS